MGRTYSTM